MRLYDANDEARAKVVALTDYLHELKFDVHYRDYDRCYYNVDQYRIIIGQDYKSNKISFDVYYRIDGPAGYFKYVASGDAEQVFGFLPKRFVEALIFKMDLLQ